MGKNISVTDVQGRVYEATYLKRARGLVKKGRAHFVDEFTICLACPPDKTEDNQMDYENSGGQIQEIQNVRRQEYEQLEELREKEAGVQAGQIEIFQAVLGQIDQVLRNTGYLEKALDGVMNADDCSDTLQAIVDIVQARETTISRMVDSAMSVLEKMLEIRNGEK